MGMSQSSQPEEESPYEPTPADGIREMSRKHSWDIIALLTKVEPNYVEVRIENPGQDAADGILVGSTRRVSFRDKDETKSFWKQLPDLSPKELLRASSDGFIDIRNVRVAIQRKQSPSPLYGDFDITDATDDSLLQRQLTFCGQLVGKRDDFAVERGLDGGLQVDGWVQSGEVCRVEQAVHQRRNLGAVLRA